MEENIIKCPSSWSGLGGMVSCETQRSSHQEFREKLSKELHLNHPLVSSSVYAPISFYACSVLLLCCADAVLCWFCVGSVMCWFCARSVLVLCWCCADSVLVPC